MACWLFAILKNKISFLFCAVEFTPMPHATRPEWQRTLIDRAYTRDIVAARKQMATEVVSKLESDHRFALQLHEERADVYITKHLITKARRLRVPTPRLYTSDNQVSDYWCEGVTTNRWHLTDIGISALRNEIRIELKGRHESRLHWVVWLSAITGVVGAITGLVAVIGRI